MLNLSSLLARLALTKNIQESIAGNADARPVLTRQCGNGEGEETDVEQDDMFWFKDGNIVLVSTERKGFQVHLGVLVMHCQFFKNLNDDAQPDGATLPLDDSSEDIKWLLSFVYKPLFFTPGTRTPYKQLAGMLRVSTKYGCDQLREAVISHLTKIYPADHAKVSKISSLIPTENREHHALFALDMCKANNVAQVLPVVYFLAATLPNSPLRNCYPALSFEDELLIQMGRVRLRDAIVQAWSYVARKDYS